jgi:hypothetical protein
MDRLKPETTARSVNGHLPCPYRKQKFPFLGVQDGATYALLFNTIDGQFEKVRMFDPDEKFTLTPDDICENVCIVVSIIQSFMKEDPSKYDVCRENENREPHFVKMKAA